MIIKYRTGFADEIERIEVMRETDKFVYRLVSHVELREKKTSATGRQYHDTWEDAKQYLIDKTQSEIASLERRLDSRRRRLADIEILKKPEA